ncbi:MAG: glycosyltransferase [Bacillota bacterium]
MRALKPHLSAAVIEHCHSSKAGIIGRLAAYLAGVRKIIFTVHGWGITPEQGRLERFFYTWAERLAGVLSTDVVCVSEADRERGLKERLAPAAKLKVIGQLVTQFEHIPFLKSEKMF